MSDFPSLTPETRAYTPGSFSNVRASTLAGGDFSVRKTNAAVGYFLSLLFVSSSTSLSSTIFNHYAIHNRFSPFDLPSSVTDGGGFVLPSGYQWIYASAPTVDYAPGRVEVTVELELVAPYKI